MDCPALRPGCNLVPVTSETLIVVSVKVHVRVSVDPDLEVAGGHGGNVDDNLGLRSRKVLPHSLVGSGVVVVNTGWPKRRPRLVAADVGLVEDANTVQGVQTEYPLIDPLLD